MSFSTPKLSLYEMLAAAKRYGYDGIEPRIAEGHRHGVELDASAAARDEIRRKAANSGIAICCVATSCRFADPKTAAQNIEEARRAIDLASDVGSPRLRVFGGQIPKEISRDEAIRGVADSLFSLADYARKANVIICLETHDDWCDPSHVAAVMQRVNHPAIAVNWDMMHPMRACGWTHERAFEALRPWVRHVHFHDGAKNEKKIELKPVGEGEFDLRRVVQILLAAKYDGYLSGEWINWESHEIHLPRDLAAMKNYERVA